MSGETIETSAALVGLGMRAITGNLTQAEYDLGVAYVMGYEDAMACKPCAPMETIDKFKEERGGRVSTFDTVRRLQSDNKRLRAENSKLIEFASQMYRSILLVPDNHIPAEIKARYFKVAVSLGLDVPDE